MFGLFETEGFPPRWLCGQWTPLHGWIHISADIAIGAAYMAIPLTLAWFVLRRREVPFFRSAWYFVAFIFTCGACHLIEASIFWHPWYRFSGMMKVVTALVSWLTVVELARVLPWALRLPGLAEVNRALRSEVQERQVAQKRVELLFEASPNALATLDELGHLLKANARFKALFSQMQPPGARFALLSWLEPEARSTVEGSLRALFQGAPGPLGPHELRLRDALGQEKALELTLCLVEQGESREVLLVMVDITEKMRARHRLEEVARALERSNQELQQMAHRDGLTQLLNRRALDALLLSLVQQSHQGRCFALILLDLDHFKAINDQHGHQAGDMVLREVARCLRQSCREVDRAARYGGEEMALLLVDVVQEEALEVAERLRLQIKQLAHLPCAVTASFGVSLSRGARSDAEDILRRADAALYQAKEAGRDCVRLG